MRTSTVSRNLTNYIIWGLSLVFWIIILFNPGRFIAMTHCKMNMCVGSDFSLKVFLKVNSFLEMILGWIFMAFAMMLPKLIVPAQNIIDQSFKKIRLPMVIFFVLGYTLTWAFAGLLIYVLILMISSQNLNSFAPTFIFGFLTLIWQFSPIKQKCLNKGHYHPVLAAWGFKAYKDAFSFGLMHGFWCVGAGWALMLFPMLLPQGHNFAMLIVTFIMLSEHLEHPQPPRWRIDFRLKLFRILVSQNLVRR
ncbi:DUF2182 domain-containing protein [Chryseobacterium sp.]|uniref:copper chaperone n=1 Tax=Chryseobacterium sp. TaxID=1871047 RepID=UPI00289BCBD4|nr:DUF2182 domain-containing protein [Chryseobacterium sp.]